MEISKSSSIMQLLNQIFEDKRNKNTHEAVKQHTIQVAESSKNPLINSLVDIKG